MGCGSGVNLYLFKNIVGCAWLGGIDYSAKLLNIAKKVVLSDDIKCKEAIDVDIDKKDEHLNYRKQCVKNYDEKYAGLDKTFYAKEDFIRFSNKVGAKCVIKEPQNELYWNNKYVFDCYTVK